MYKDMKKMNGLFLLPSAIVFIFAPAKWSSESADNETGSRAVPFRKALPSQRTVQHSDYPDLSGLSSYPVVKMEALVDPNGETIWTSQRAMADLFGVNPQAITRHLQHIYEEGELVKEATCSKMEQVRREGERTVVRQMEFYNFDAMFGVIIPASG